MRVFVAIPLPEAVRRAVGTLQQRLQGALAVPARWTPQDNLHLTLRFLGEVPEAEVSRLERALAPIGGFSRFAIRFAGLSGFPSRRRARVLWLGLAEGAGPVQDLAEALDLQLADCDFAPRDRPFLPHLTLARIGHQTPQTSLALENSRTSSNLEHTDCISCDPKKPQNSRYLRDLHGFGDRCELARFRGKFVDCEAALGESFARPALPESPLVTEVDQVVLYRSTLRSKGATHEALACVSLTPTLRSAST